MDIGDPYSVYGQNIQIWPDLQLCVNEPLFMEGKEVPGKRDYNHFGAAKDLPGLRGQRHWRSVCCLQSKYSDPAGVNNILLREGKEVPGNRGYKYFGAAKDLQGVRGHRMTDIGDPYTVYGQNI